MRYQLQRIDGEAQRMPPKSSASRRSIQLRPLAVTALDRHRLQHGREKLALGEAWQDTWGLVFTSEVGAPLRPNNIRRRSFHRILQSAGLPEIRFHDLRHTAATLLLQANEHPKKVQALLGHSTITLTLDTYSHVTPDMQEKTAAKMQSILTAVKRSR